jgi:hypothetical protein
MGKKPSRRSKEKYPALIPHLNLRTRFEEIDYDYVDQLSDSEKDFLNRFTEEYTNASFRHKNRVHKKKKDELEAYTRNNQRNADILTRAKASGKIYGLEVIKFSSDQLSPEEIMIQREDLKEFINRGDILAMAEIDKNVKRLVDELREKLEDLEQLFYEMHSCNNSSD